MKHLLLLSVLVLLAAAMPPVASTALGAPQEAAAGRSDEDAVRAVVEGVLARRVEGQIRWADYMDAERLVDRSLTWLSDEAAVKVKADLRELPFLVFHGSEAMQMAWMAFEPGYGQVVSAEIDGDRAEVGVVAMLTGRPWLFRLSNVPERGWRWIDTECVTTGWTFSLAAACSGLERVHGDAPDAETLALLDLDSALRAAMVGDWDEARPALDRLRASDAHGARWSSMVDVVCAAGEGDLAQLAERADGERPLPRAVLVAARSLGMGDALEADLRNHLERLPWDVDATEELAAILEDRGEVDAALVLRRELCERCSGVVPALLRLMDALPPDQHGEIAERFASAPDPARTIETLAGALLDRGAIRVADACLDVVQRVDPRDHNVAYYRAEIWIGEGRFAEAAALVAQAFVRAEELGELSFFHTHFVWAMDGAGKAVEAYRIADRSAAALERTLQALERREEWDRVVALCEEHREQGVEDFAALDLWQARGAWAQGNAEAAAEFAGAAMESAESDRDWERALSIRLDALFELGGWERAYDGLQPPETAFWRVASRLSGSGDGAALAELIERHRASGADPAQVGLAFWECEVVYLSGTPEEAVQALDANREAIVASELSGVLYRFEDRLVRSLLRSGEHERALALALEIDTRDSDPFYTALVHTVRGDVPAAREAVGRCLDVGWSAEELLEDPDLGPPIGAPEYADLLGEGASD